MRFVKMSPIDRMRAGILKSLNKSEEQLAALPAAERQKIEDLIKSKIQEALSGKAGSGGDKSAATSGVTSPAGVAPTSADTLGGLIAVQAAAAGSSSRAAV